MILGGRYMQEEYSSDFAGMPFQGLMIMGRHNASGEYVSMWIDSFGTSMAFSTGHKADDGWVKLTGTMRDLFTPQGRPFRVDSLQVSANEAQMRMYDSMPDGTEFMVMDVTYTRK